MGFYDDPPIALGQTLGLTTPNDSLNGPSAGYGTNVVGIVKLFPDVNPITGVVRSNGLKRCIAVKNSSGTTLYGKRLVAFKAGSTTEVDAYIRTTDGNGPAGVTDEYLPPAGVADGEVFLITVAGPTEVHLGTGLASSADSDMFGVTAAAGGATNAATGGFAQTVSVTNTTSHRNAIGRALSTVASVAATTNVCLVNINLSRS